MTDQSNRTNTYVDIVH